MSPSLGIHVGMPEAEYRSASGINQSRLKLVSHSLEAYKADADLEDDEESKRSSALRIGTAVHAAAADLQSFCKTYISLPEGARRSTSTEHKQAVARGFSDDTILSHSEMNKVKGMLSSLFDLPEYATLATGADKEVALFGEDGPTGLIKKALVDIRPHNCRALVDIKTIRSGWCTSRKFASRCAEMGYDIQAAWYLDLYNELCDPDDRRDQFWFIVVESAPPFLARAFVMDPSWVEEARKIYREHLDVIAHAEATGVWVQSRKPEIITRPRWALWK